MSVSLFLPTRKGSQRVINKNTKPFSDVEGGILELKLRELIKVRNIDQIILSTNDEESIRVAELVNSSKILVIERPDRLCQSSTLIEDFINYIPTIVDTEHIFWVHATTPFVLTQDYELALATYLEKISRSWDSLLSVTKYQKFLWDVEKNDVINFNRQEIKWPQTQDLTPLYEINHAFYISSRVNYLKYHDRIGIKPYMYELNHLKSFDIDWEEDFLIGEAIYEKLKKSGLSEAH